MKTKIANISLELWKAGMRRRGELMAEGKGEVTIAEALDDLLETKK